MYGGNDQSPWLVWSLALKTRPKRFLARFPAPLSLMVGLEAAGFIRLPFSTGFLGFIGDNPGMSSAIQDLQKAILDPGQSPTQLLRRTKMIAGELHLADVETWVDRELRGYPDDVDPPAYRVLTTDSLLVYNPVRGWQFAGDVQHRMRARHPIAEIESMSKAKSPQFTPETNFRLEGGFGSDWPQRVTIDRSQFHNILEAVKEELVQWTTELRKRGIKGEDMNFDEKEKQSAGNMVFNIGSVQGNVGNVSHSQANFQNYSSISQMLVDRNVPMRERHELEGIMEELKSAPPAKKPSLIQKGKDWIVKNKEFLGASAEAVGKAIGAAIGNDEIHHALGPGLGTEDRPGKINKPGGDLIMLVALLKHVFAAVRSRSLALHGKSLPGQAASGSSLQRAPRPALGSKSRLVRARAWERWQNGFGNITNGTRGCEILSLRMKGPEWNGRPIEEAQTRKARAARPSIVAGANGRVSGTEGLSG
jgi:hypothetical protein